MLLDLFNVIDDFDVQPEEFWSALSYLTELGQRNEYSLLSAGLGIDHYFDVRLDEKESQVGIEPGGTPRTIEGRSTSPAPRLPGRGPAGRRHGRGRDPVHGRSR